MDSINQINYVQYNLPFTAEQDQQMEASGAGLTWWMGVDPTTEEGEQEISGELEDSTIVISHLGIYCKADCQIAIKNYEYKEDKWVVCTHIIQMGSGNKIEFKNVLICGVGTVLKEEDQSEEYWGPNAQLIMAITDYGTVKKLEQGYDYNIDSIALDPFSPV